MSEKEINWIEEAKEHFEKYGGKEYIKEDTISIKSKDINQKITGGHYGNNRNNDNR